MTATAPAPDAWTAAPPRSYLFVPGDRPERFAKACESGADAVIFDLEDSVAATAKARARSHVATYLREARNVAQHPRLVVRINDLESGLADDDLEALTVLPDAVMLPKAVGGATVAHLDAKLAVREAYANQPTPSVRILPIATESARAVLAAASYAASSPRLAGLTWGAEDLSVDLGAHASRDAHGQWTDPFRLARAMCLMAAAAAGVQAIDGVNVHIGDSDNLRNECRDAWRDGFTGKLAIHPAQVPVINACFMPDEADIAHARAVVAAFAASDGTGAVALNGTMQDVPHLRRAQRLLALADRRR